MRQRARIRPAPRPRDLEDPHVLRDFVRRVGEGIYITNARGEILDANPAFLEMIGVASLEELRALSVAEIIVDPEQRRRELELLDRDGMVREYELRIRRADGQIRTVLDTMYARLDPETRERRFHGILVDITGRKLLEEHLLELSVRDPLTGCYNRRHLTDASRCMAARPHEPWGCIFIDVDHFKRYNDRFGHLAGDDILVKLSRFLMRQVRAEEAVVRMGGDEFVILLSGAAGAHTQRIAERLHAAAVREAPVEFSLGWAVREPGETLERLLARADDDLLEVRTSQRALPDRRV